MHGTASFDVATLHAGGDGVQFDAGCCAPHVQQLLGALLRDAPAHGWGPRQARELLQYCTALSVLPPAWHDKSLQRHPIRVCSVAAWEEGGSADNTPTASTCTRTLYVPEAYASVAAMVERFEKAFEHQSTSGFRYA